MFHDSTLPSNLKEIAHSLAESSKKVGLDFFPTLFEIVDYKQLNEIAAYGGFPTRYPHWRWGMEYQQLSKSYTYGLSVIYEMVINNNPCYAYLLRSNTLASQKTVIAHVYGHSDFFKNNYWFSGTDRKMLDTMANHATTVRRLINEVGKDTVESFIDCCLSIENLIDIQAPFKAKKPPPQELDDDSKKTKNEYFKFNAKSYMDHYVNPKQAKHTQENKVAKEKEKEPKIALDRDVLGFLLEKAPLNAWQKKILSIIRSEAYYFAPQGQTKILNEGWATYWHSKMMTEISPLPAQDIIDYCDSYSSIIANHPGNINPYRLGLNLLRHVEERWDKGRFGAEYTECKDPKTRRAWDKKLGEGKKKLFEIRSFHNDITFIDAFLDEDFCHKTQMFLYDFDPQKQKFVISTREFQSIKQEILRQLTNLGQPLIYVKDDNFSNRSELLLSHLSEGKDLKHEQTLETLKKLFQIWKRPVHMETIIESTKKRVSFDGKNTSIEKF